MVDILDRITKQRLLRNWTEYELAQRSELPQSTISSWYRKKMLPSLASLEKICHAFDMTMALPGRKRQPDRNHTRAGKPA